MEGRLMSVIETNFGARIDPKRVALGSASNVKKQGAFFVFSIRVDNDDVRESIIKPCITKVGTTSDSNENGFVSNILPLC